MLRPCKNWTDSVTAVAIVICDDFNFGGLFSVDVRRVSMRSGLFLMGPAQTELLPQFSWEALPVCEPLVESASVDAGGSGSAVQGCFSKNAELGGEFSRFLYIGSWFPIGMAAPGVP